MSDKYGKPILKYDLLQDLAQNNISFVDDLSQYLINVNNVQKRTDIIRPTNLKLFILCDGIMNNTLLTGKSLLSSLQSNFSFI